MQECPKLCPSFIACFIHSIQGSLVMGRDPAALPALERVYYSCVDDMSITEMEEVRQTSLQLTRCLHHSSLLPGSTDVFKLFFCWIKLAKGPQGENPFPSSGTCQDTGAPACPFLVWRQRHLLRQAVSPHPWPSRCIPQQGGGSANLLLAWPGSRNTAPSSRLPEHRSAVPCFCRVAHFLPAASKGMGRSSKRQVRNSAATLVAIGHICASPGRNTYRNLNQT